MKKKVRVDFSAHTSVVVAVEDDDDMYDKSAPRNAVRNDLNG